MLLNVPFKEQKVLKKRFRGVVKKVRKNWRDPNCINAVGVPRSKSQRDAFVVAAYRESQNELRHELARNISNEIFADGHTTRCLIIGVNIDKDHYPYSFLAVYDRPPSSD